MYTLPSPLAEVVSPSMVCVYSVDEREREGWVVTSHLAVGFFVHIHKNTLSSNVEYGLLCI